MQFLQKCIKIGNKITILELVCLLFLLYCKITCLDVSHMFISLSCFYLRHENHRFAELLDFHHLLTKLIKLFMPILTQKMTQYLIIILFSNNKIKHFQSKTLDNSSYFFQPNH